MIRKSTINLLNFGIENEDYVILEDGRIDYPEGQDANSVGYSVNETWLFGNQYLSHVFVPLDADVREQSRQINDSAELSPLFGFTTDISDYSTEITGLTNAYNTYARGLHCGTMDVDEAINPSCI